MSGRVRGSNIKWESSTEEDDMYESKHKIKLRESLRNSQQPAVIENEIDTEPRRRGRGPSKRPCLNRNAMMARENRLKKKAYLEKVENKLAFYQKENKNLINIIKKQSIDIKRLNGEVAYLKSVLNNNTSITVLLKTINDGLRKMNAQKKNLSSHLHSVGSNDLISQHKCSCYTNIKENILNSQNTNVFITNVHNDSLAEGNTNENEESESYVNPRRQLTFDIKNGSQNKEPINTASAINSIAEDGYIENPKDLHGLLPIVPTDLTSIEEKKDTSDTIGIDFDQLSTFNMDIFEDLPKCDDIMNTVDSLDDGSSLFTEEEISQTLDNTGICLHVNSDKVSLEFCSICHLNSKNSGSN